MSCRQSPVKPTDRVVLNVGIVVTLLASSALVASQKHGYSLREKQQSQKIPNLPLTSAFNRGVGCRSLDAIVAADVVGISRFFKVRFIVLGVVAYDIV